MIETSSTRARPIRSPELSKNSAAPPAASTFRPPSANKTSNSTRNRPASSAISTRPEAVARPTNSTEPWISSRKPGLTVCVPLPTMIVFAIEKVLSWKVAEPTILIAPARSSDRLKLP